jgi:predicted nucleotidyltransferase
MRQLPLRGSSIGELAFFSLADIRHRRDGIGHITQEKGTASTGPFQENTGRAKYKTVIICMKANETHVAEGAKTVPLKPETQNILIESAKKYDVKSLWLFGSSLTGDEDDAGDIDLGVEGIDRSSAWDMYSELFDTLHEHCRKPLDFVEMDEPLSIVHVIRSEGIKIYERNP